MQSSESAHNLRVKPHVFVKVLGYGFAALCSLGALMSWQAGQGSVSPYFLLLAVLGILIHLLYGTVEADEYVITYILPLWRFEIRWDEVAYVEVDGDGYSMVFVGEQKRLPIMGPPFWARTNKEELGRLIIAQMEKRHIPLRYTQKAAYRLPKNTRVR